MRFTFLLFVFVLSLNVKAQEGSLDFKLFLKQNIHATNCLKSIKNLTACIFVLEEMYYVTHKSYFILVPQDNIVHKKIDLSFIGSIDGDHRSDFKEFRIGNASMMFSRLKQNFQTNFEALLQKTMNDFFKKEYGEDLYLELANDYLQIAINQYTYFYSTSSFRKRINALNLYDDKNIGANFVMIGDHLYVSEVSDKSSAEMAGLKSGDEVLSINKEKITAIEELNELLLNDFDFSFLIRRQMSFIPLQISKTQLVIPNLSMKVLSRNNKKIGILKIRSFMPNSTCKDALQLIRANKLQTLLIDLRDNGGGQVDQVKCVAGIFLGKSAIFNEYSSEKKGQETQEKMPERYFGKLAVLMNAATASASEILALALVDNNRAILLGERSYGKGSIIQGQKIDKNYSLKGIIGFFTSPKTNYSHQGIGIFPQIEIKQNKIIAAKDTQRESDIEYFPMFLSVQKKKITSALLTDEILACAQKIKKISSPLDALQNDYLNSHNFFDTQLAQSVMIMGDCYSK